MNKKSNVVVGGAGVVVIGLAVAGMTFFGGSGKGEAPVQEVSVARSAVTESVTAVPTVSNGTAAGNFVASKQGKKYFPLGCGTAKSIKEENKVFFGSEAEAEQAGYERSLTCK